MSRYSNTEQLGVIAVSTIVTESMNWIYRPVPPPDVGIDGTIEQVINGNPTAKFIAVQLKTGLSHFSHNKRKNRLTYRASLVHYNYWMSSNIPVILVVHIPKWGKTYWQEMHKSKFKRLRKSWQLEIPLTQSLNISSIKDFNKILLQQEKRELSSGVNKTIYDLMEDSGLVFEATRSVTTISDLLKSTANKANELTTKMIEFADRNIGFDNPEVDAVMTRSGRYFYQMAQRFSLQVELFAENYALSISALPKLMKLQYEISGEYDDIQDTTEALDGLMMATSVSISSMKGFQETLAGMEKQRNDLYNEGLEELYQSITQVVDEFSVALDMTTNMKDDLLEL